MVKLSLFILYFCFIFLRPVMAGAWLQPPGSGQSIVKFTYTVAQHNFGHNYHVHFEKLVTQNYAEREISPHITVFSAPEYTIASYKSVYGLRTGNDYAIKTGLRFGGQTGFGAASLQVSYKYGQAFSMMVSDNVNTSQEVEIRPQSGINFRILGIDSFADIEGLWRWAALPRPNEAGGDITVGMQLLPSTQLMMQNFSTFSAGFGARDYSHYRQQKFKLSLVQRLWGGWRVQFGGIYAWSGHNVVAERGLSLAVWVNF